MHQTTPTQETHVDEPLMTASEVMRYLHISRSTLYRLMRQGKLKGYKPSGFMWKFYKDDVKQAIRKEERTQHNGHE